MKKLSATDAARHFSTVLDGVEFDGESYLIARRGRVVARLVPAKGSGAAVKAVLRDADIDASWASELAEMRSQLPVQERDWSC